MVLALESRRISNSIERMSGRANPSQKRQKPVTKTPLRAELGARYPTLAAAAELGRWPAVAPYARSVPDIA
eukprot:226996-Rhodomonas_salina.1